MSHRVRAALLALLLVTVSAPVAASSGPSVGLGQQQIAGTPTDSPPIGLTSITVNLTSDGDAHWSVTTYLDATTDENGASFESVAERFEDGHTDSLGLTAFERAESILDETADREMNITGVDRTSNRTDSSLTLSFTWTNFAREDDGVLYADDVWNTSSGTWFTGIQADQRLILELPPNSIRSAPKRVQNGRIVWEGPQTFTGDDLHVAYSKSGSPDGPGSRGGPWLPRGGSSALWGSFFAVGIGIAVISVYVLSRRDDDAFGGGTTAAPSEDVANRSTPAADAEADSEEADDQADEDEVDVELLSDEERVERLLEQNGGRMKQASIVKETGWSNAKVSQLLSAMEEADQIDKLRIGRENLISFPDEDVTDIDG